MSTAAAAAWTWPERLPRAEDRDCGPQPLECGFGIRPDHLGELSTTLQEDFRNRLIWGDNKLIMALLLKEFRGKIDLIYLGPPF